MKVESKCVRGHGYFRVVGTPDQYQFTEFYFDSDLEEDEFVCGCVHLGRFQGSFEKDDLDLDEVTRKITKALPAFHKKILKAKYGMIELTFNGMYDHVEKAFIDAGYILVSTYFNPNTHNTLRSYQFIVSNPKTKKVIKHV